jgi:hypothetical protein
LEIIASVAIVLILLTLLIGVASRLPGIADRARCSTNLKGLALGLESYLQDQGHWPNQPRGFGENQQKAYEDWWIKELKPYDVPDSAWQCPAILRLGKIQRTGRSPRVHYSPTMFDQKPSTPHKWPNMPWLVEIANVHGHGPLMIMPDGSVHDYDIYVSKYIH